MTVKCSTARILLTVIFCAELVALVFSGETWRKTDEKVKEIVTENLGEYPSDHNTRRPDYQTQPTTNYAISPAEEVNQFGKENSIASDKDTGIFSSSEAALEINADASYQTSTAGITKTDWSEPTKKPTTDFDSKFSSSSSNFKDTNVESNRQTTPSSISSTDTQEEMSTTFEDTSFTPIVAQTSYSDSETILKEKEPATTGTTTTNMVERHKNTIPQSGFSEKVEEFAETHTVSSDNDAESSTNIEIANGMNAADNKLQTFSTDITKTTWTESTLTKEPTTDFDSKFYSSSSNTNDVNDEGTRQTTPSSIPSTETQEEMLTKSEDTRFTSIVTQTIYSTTVETESTSTDDGYITSAIPNIYDEKVAFSAETYSDYMGSTKNQDSLARVIGKSTNMDVYNPFNITEVDAVAVTSAYSQSNDLSDIDEPGTYFLRGDRKPRRDKRKKKKKWKKEETTETTTTVFTEICSDSTIFDYEISALGKTSFEVNWKLADSDNCELVIKLSCNSTDDSFDWIVPYQSASTDVFDSDAVSSLKNLSEFTNYSCVGQLSMKGDDETILSDRTFNVTTLPEVPSDIIFKVSNISAKGFTLSWHRPFKIPGNLRKYHIVMQKKSSHYIRKECVSTSIGKIISFSSEMEMIPFNYLDAKPNYLYEIEILAEDEAGNSTGIKQNFSTKSYRSTKPLNVTSILHNYTNHCMDDDYNTTLELNWELPCNTNGELIKFQVKITEIIYSDKNSHRTGSNTIYEVDVNSDIKKLTYELTVENLNASSIYNVTIAAITANNSYGFETSHTTDRTPDGCPSVPTRITSSVRDSSSFYLDWKEPEEFFGEIKSYSVKILNCGPKHDLSNDPTCRKLSEYQTETIIETDATNLYYDKGRPNFIYNFTIEARTSAGVGKPSEVKSVVTSTTESEPIRNMEIRKIEEVNTDKTFEYKVQITFKEPCNTNGLFRYYLIEETGRRIGYPNVSSDTRLNETTHEEILRKPEYNFEFAIKVITENANSSHPVTQGIKTSTGIPILNEKKLPFFVNNKDNPTELQVKIEKDMFSNENGEIIRYAIILYEDAANSSISKEQSYGVCNVSCPDLDKTFPLIKAASIYQLTPPNWNPFKDRISKSTISIGKKDHCDKNEFCQPVLEDTNYIVLLRGITNSTYRDILIFTKTGIIPSSSLAVIISLSVLLVAVVLGIYLYMKREHFLSIRFRSIPETISEEVIHRHVVALKNFIAYCDKTANDPTILRKQYEEIDDETKIYKVQNAHTVFALKPENIRKNRYTNILPYDEYRVKLKMDEDDEISSDYINASYIRGASGEVEYIATQGPLDHTCKDFWKMVIQENVTVIVMVSQFVEKQKEKCFKYFPNNHENMMICEDLEVKCLTELQFDTHCVRTLLIRKDTQKYSIIHMQYLDWPDFGCPSGTYNMISFCQDVRDRIQFEKGLMAVHCSAGVGRTGTLISLDILLQTMKKEKEISVFECVLKLRKQRTHMVQTEKQYVYIHTCLKDVLENCSSYSYDDTKKDDAHVYQNVNEKNRGLKGTKCKEEESAF